MIFQLVPKVCDLPATQSFLQEIKASPQKASTLMGVLPREDPSYSWCGCKHAAFTGPGSQLSCMASLWDIQQLTLKKDNLIFDSNLTTCQNWTCERNREANPWQSSQALIWVITLAVAALFNMNLAFSPSHLLSL